MERRGDGLQHAVDAGEPPPAARQPALALSPQRGMHDGLQRTAGHRRRDRPEIPRPSACLAAGAVGHVCEQFCAACHAQPDESHSPLRGGRGGAHALRRRPATPYQRGAVLLVLLSVVERPERASLAERPDEPVAPCRTASAASPTAQRRLLVRQLQRAGVDGLDFLCLAYGRREGGDRHGGHVCHSPLSQQGASERCEQSVCVLRRADQPGGRDHGGGHGGGYAGAQPGAVRPVSALRLLPRRYLGALAGSGRRVCGGPSRVARPLPVAQGHRADRPLRGVRHGPGAEADCRIGNPRACLAARRPVGRRVVAQRGGRVVRQPRGGCPARLPSVAGRGGHGLRLS